MRERSYKAEYERRIAKGIASGLSRSQARGHAKASEAQIRPPRLALSEERIQVALRALRKERNIALAAKSAKISPERLRKYAIEHRLIEKEGRRWRPKASLPRRMLLFSQGKASSITVGNADTASEVGRFMSAVGRFLQTNKASLLASFKGHGVHDVKGKFYPYETRENALYRLGAGSDASFEQIYRIVI